jgi:hypothetical protein
MQNSSGWTYTPLYSVDNESACTADSDTAEEHGSAFTLIGTAGDAEGAWSRWLLLLV